MRNLGQTCQDMGMAAEAEKLFTNSMSISLAISGPGDIAVATSHGRLANLYLYKLHDYSKAEKHFLQSSNIAEKLFGPAHSQLQYDYGGMIVLYRKTGEEA